MKRLLVIGTLFISGCIATDCTTVEGEADACDSIVKWNIPVARNNGQALQLSEIYAFHVKRTNPEDEDFEKVMLQLETTWRDINPGPGTWTYSVRTVDTDGLVSAWSDPKSKTYPIVPDNA